MLLLDLIILFISVLLIVLVMNSVILTIVVPRGEKLLFGRIFLALLLESYKMLTHFLKSYKTRDRIFARIGPTALLAVPMFALVGIILGFAGIYWVLGNELGNESFVEALKLSGSSVTTLGFLSSEDNLVIAFSILEAVLGLGIVALVFGYLPTIYSIFRIREIKVSAWANRAGSPPSIERFVLFADEVDLLGRMKIEWYDWEIWFGEIHESHLSYPTLNFFRSPSLHDSWIVTAGNVLDTASFIESSVDTESETGAQLCIKSGSKTLRDLAEYFDIDPEEPLLDNPISCTKEAFMETFNRLKDQGVNVIDDAEEAWQDFSALRLQYAAPLKGLLELINFYAEEYVPMKTLESQESQESQKA